MIYNKFLIISIGILLSTLVPSRAKAATLYLLPQSPAVYQGDTFIVEAGIDTEGEEVNAITARLIFDQNLLKVVDFSKGDSILNLWVEEPNVKTDGIFFVGGIPQGFNGKGRILRIIFQVEKDGQGNIDFAENSRALLNDGLGTPAKFAAQGAVITVLPGKSVIPSDAWKKELERDKTAPEPFKIEIGRDLSVLEGKYFLSFVAADKQTGIDHYEVKEGEGDWVRAERPYLLQDQSLKSKILVKAVDKAGNEKVVEYTSPRKLFSYWIIIAVLVVGLVIWRVIKRFKR